MHAATFIDGRVRLHDAVSATGIPLLDGVVVGGFTDHHVHLQLIEHGLLAGSRLGRVVDLGGNPEAVHRLAPQSLTVLFAGAFLTAPGGYLSDRSWAPEGSVREVSDVDSVAAAAAEMADAGAACIKVASNSAAGPVLTDELFRAIVRAAAGLDLPVVAHAEGAGEAQRVVLLGATRLAHAPFTERARRYPLRGSPRWRSTTIPSVRSQSTTCAASTPLTAPCSTAPTWATDRCRST